MRLFRYQLVGLIVACALVAHGAPASSASISTRPGPAASGGLLPATLPAPTNLHFTTNVAECKAHYPPWDCAAVLHSGRRVLVFDYSGPRASVATYSTTSGLLDWLKSTAFFIDGAKRFDCYYVTVYTGVGQPDPGTESPKSNRACGPTLTAALHQTH